MQTFEILSELNNYVPNCLICSKPMRFNLDAFITSEKNKKPLWGSGNTTLRLKMELKEGILVSTHRTINVSIDIATNQVTDGADLMNRLGAGNTHIKKMCPTCHFKINTVYGRNNSKKENYFPTLTLESEELHYTLKGGKDVEISKYYRENDPSKSKTATIRLSHKYLPPIPFDFNKFEDLEQLNKRLATIILFH